MKKGILSIVVWVSIVTHMNGQSLFSAVYDSTTFTQRSSQQTDTTLVFLGGVNIVETAPIRSNNVFYKGREIMAQLQGNFVVGSNYSEQAILISGNMENDSIVTCAIAKVTGDSLLCFRLYRIDDLTLKAQYPLVTELPSRSGCTLDGHDMAASRSGYAAVTYNYQTNTTRYGDSIGSFNNVILQETVISDSMHNLIREIDWRNIFPDSVWNPTRSVQPGVWKPLSRLDPFHINSIEFINDSLLLVSARSLGVIVFNWQTLSVDHFIPEDSDGIILQHNVRYLGGDVISIFSDGDQVVPPKGLLVNLGTGLVSGITLFPDDSLRTFAMGAYQHTDSWDLMCTGIQDNPYEPFSFQNLSGSVRAVTITGDTLFDWKSDLGVYSAHLLVRAGWGNDISVSRLGYDTVMVIAEHPISNQVPVWFGYKSGGWSKVALGDTFQIQMGDFDSLFYEVPARDTSGWEFISSKINPSLVNGIKDVRTQYNIHLYPNPAAEAVTVDIQGDFTYSISTIDGKMVRNGLLKNGSNVISLNSLSPGSYVLSAGENSVILFVQ